MAYPTQRFQQWADQADQLVDLCARNELINFRETKTSTIFPSDNSVQGLLKGESMLLSDKGGKNVVKITHENMKHAVRENRAHWCPVRRLFIG